MAMLLLIAIAMALAVSGTVATPEGGGRYDGVQDYVQVNTTTGPLRGLIHTPALAGNTTVNVFLGIPYATPPVGDLRFEPPQYPHASWTGTRSALAFGDSCIQNMKDQHIPGPSSEDCLFLNVYAAQPPVNHVNRTALPVMLWIYGGGFHSGSTTIYDGVAIAALGNVVVVTVNYRLGALGFLVSSDKNAIPGNMGLMDQFVAMQWVRDNIAAFGGDPNRVTIFGESAGGASVSLHLLSPFSKGYYIRAIAESGASLNPWALRTLDVVGSSSMELAQQLKCGGEFTISLTCLRKVPAEQILEVQQDISAKWTAEIRGPPFVPVADGNFLPSNPITALKNKQYNDVEFLSGVNHDEWSLFLQKYIDNTNPGINATTFNMWLERYAHNGFWGFPNITGNTALLESIKFMYTDWFNPNSDRQRLSQIIQAGSDFAFVCPFHTEATLFSASSKLYMYQFSHVDGTHPAWAGVPHAAEVFYVFGLPLLLESGSTLTFPRLFPNYVPEGFPYTEADKLVSRNIIKIWTTFAWTGDPSGGLPSNSSFTSWPLYNSVSRPYVDINTEITLGGFLHNDKCEALTQLAPILADDCHSG